MKIERKKSYPFSTRPKGAIYAYDSDAGLDEHIKAYKEGAPADSLVLNMLADKYEEALKSPYLRGPEHAEAIFWLEVKKFENGGLLTQVEFDIMNKAKGGDLRAVQTLVKANSRIIRLPFVQDALIEILRQQKYSTEKKGASIKDKWEGFLHARPKGKIMYTPENVSFLIERAQDILNRKRKEVFMGTDADVRQTAEEAVSAELKISPDKVKKMTAVRGLRGRPKKS